MLTTTSLGINMIDELAIALMVLCLLILAGILAVFIADYLLELRKVKLLESCKDELVREARSRLFQDYRNLEEWVANAEEMRFKLEILQEEIEIVREVRSKLQGRDKLGRFTKKGN